MLKFVFLQVQAKQNGNSFQCYSFFIGTRNKQEQDGNNFNLQVHIGRGRTQIFLAGERGERCQGD